MPLKMSKDKLNINYWLRKIYVSKIFHYLPFGKIFLRKIIFTSIFKSKHWVQNSNLPKEKISVSGHGSNIDTEQSMNLISSEELIFPIEIAEIYGPITAFRSSKNKPDSIELILGITGIFAECINGKKS